MIQRVRVLAGNIALLPIDKNSNGTIDYSENIYENFAAFTRGIWIGKYPKSLIRSIYSVAAEQPVNEAETAFLNWILNDGQQLVMEGGYSDLLVTERQSSSDKLNTAQVYTGTSDDRMPLGKAILILVILFIVSGLIIDMVIRYQRRKNTDLQNADPGSVTIGVLDENNLVVPGGLYFDKTHTWAFMEQDGIVRVGIDDFMQHITGTVDKVKNDKHWD